MPLRDAEGLPLLLRLRLAPWEPLPVAELLPEATTDSEAEGEPLPVRVADVLSSAPDSVGEGELLLLLLPGELPELLPDRGGGAEGD